MLRTRSITEVAAATGVSTSSLSNIARRKHDRVQQRVADAILGATVPPARMSARALGARRRVEALHAAGWPFAWIAAEAGVTDRYVMRIAAGAAETMRTPEFERIASAYERLAFTAPRDCRQTRDARTRAAARGFAPPAAWDNIDDPREQPKGMTTAAAA